MGWLGGILGGLGTGLPTGTPTGTPPWWPTSPIPAPPSGGGNTLGLPNSTWQTILQAVGLGTGILGSVLNRPQGLSDSQRRALDSLMLNLSAQANAPLTVDPAARNALFEQIAGSAQGARNRIQNDFSGRGLGRSGLRGEELGRVERTAQNAQTAGVAELLQDAQNRRTQAQGQLQSLLFGIPATQGASAAGTTLSSISQTLGYLLALNAFGKRNS